MKNQEFLSQKRSNFAQYLRGILTELAKSNQAINDNYAEYIDNINNIQMSPLDDFLKYILFKIVPHADKLDNAVEMLLVENKLKREYFTKDQLEKVKLYFNCFIDVVSN